VSDGVFDRLAPRYDELRGELERWEEQLRVSIDEGLGGATRVLDVGCGTGSLVALLVERLGVRAWGVDASGAMIEQARRRGLRGVGFKQAQADALPFRDGWFDAVTMRLVVHLLGERRPAVFAELARVLRPEGRLFVWTFGEAHLDGFYLAPYLPTLTEVDRARFPPEEQLCTELEAAGFARTWRRRVDVDRLVDRARAAERLRAGYISTISLLDPDEVEAGARRLDEEAAAGAPPLEATQRWVLVAAER
jgi:ubiquinone/menaquinone biosynthesis C-methylase UbiE